MTDTLHPFLGISETRFKTIITPFMDKLCKDCTKVADALLQIEGNDDLQAIDKIYCSYAIGRVVGMDEVVSKTNRIAKRLGIFKTEN